MAETKTKVVLLDIEGTTTPITFVTESLFPYSSKHLETFVRDRYSEPQVRQSIDLVREQAKKDVQEGFEGAVEVPEEGGDGGREDVIVKALQNLRLAIEKNRKVTGLKLLQGLIWRGGYESGELKGVVYPDVTEAFKRWTSASPPLKLYIYSSGSIEAQKLIFGYSDQGDLLPNLSGHFDTTSGLKTVSQSYKTISSQISPNDPSEILFLTDNPQEAKSSIEAGMRSLLLVRPGNTALTEEDRKIADVVDNFDEVDRYL